MRMPTAQLQAQDKVLRKQLFLAISFLFAIVGMCCLNFKTYQPGARKVASEENEVAAGEIQNLKAENETMHKAIQNLKRELAAEKKKANSEVKTEEEKQPEAQVAGDKEEVSTASNLKK
jgi:hypothetical protein